MSAPIEPLVCAGCGAKVPWTEPFPFRCPDAHSGDDIDHVLGRKRATEGVPLSLREDPNPFVRHFMHFQSWQVARGKHGNEREHLEAIRDLDRRVADVCGHGFLDTPYLRSDELGVWIKDETGNVAGSHKGRHLFGIALFLEAAGRHGLVTGADLSRPLAIASCGNAALAAAVVARALDRHLDVYLPTWADSAVVDQLCAHGASLVVCERRESDPPGDPCYLRFVEAVATGAIPFTCQGSQNGLTIEGGRTLAWELVHQHAATGAPPLDRLFVQIGGGALASSTIQGLRWARQSGVLAKLPRVHAVQTESCHPLREAWRRVVEAAVSDPWAQREHPPDRDDLPALGAWLREHAGDRATLNALRHAAHHRSAYMEPAAGEPRSLAKGILDDETYDWLEVVRGMIETGGWPVVVSEEGLAKARDRGRDATGIAVDATGAAGLAGWRGSCDANEVETGEQVAVLFTGGDRPPVFSPGD